MSENHAASSLDAVAPDPVEAMSEVGFGQQDVAASATGASVAVPLAPTFHAVPAAEALPGHLLREAREARGLTVADVVGTLKFSPRQVEALEADDYNKLQGTTVVRGFVRCYARYLKLAPEPLLAMLDSGAPMERADVRPPDDTGAAMPLPGEHRLSPWIAGSIILGLIAAALSAWQIISPGAIIPTPREAHVAQSVQPPQVQPPEVQQSEVAVAPPMTTVAADSAAIAPNPPAAAVSAPPTTPPATATISTPASAPAVALPLGSRQLIFSFTSKAWIEVKDASGRTVLNGEFPAGTRQVAGGKPPLQLWIGRASGVRVFDGDREVDLKPHARDDVARLAIE